MRLFLTGSYDDTNYLTNLAPLVKGNSVKFKLEDPTMLQEIVQWCKIYEADAVICTNAVSLDKILNAQLDFSPPNTRKGITLDDYQGSLLSLRVGDRTIPVVVLNPLEHLVKVPYGKFVATRFLSKIIAPEKWLEVPKFQWKLVTHENMEEVVERLSMARLLGVDIETAVGDPDRRINCVGYAGLFLGHDNQYTIECYVFPFTAELYAGVRRVNDNIVPKVFQNGLYDNLYFLRWGIPVRCWYWDTYHLFHSWFAELPRDLGFIGAFSVRSIRYWKDDGKSGNLEAYYRYNAMDCWATVCSWLGLLRDCPDWALKNYGEFEFPMVFPSLSAECEGIKVDEPRFQEVYARKIAEKDQQLLKIQTMVGTKVDTLPLAKKSDGSPIITGFNPNSPKQMLALFTMLGCGRLGSTDKIATLKAKAAHPLNDVILTATSEWKSNAKVLGTYLQDTKLWGGRLYYKIDPAGTETGRSASKASSYWCGFQIQNIPRDDTVKQCLVADDGWLLGEGDFAQSEARCVGYMSGETKLIDVVEGPHDYHAFNASQFFGVAYQTIYNDELHKTLNKSLRDLSKRTNHGANYNMGEGVLLDTMGPKYVIDAKRLLKLPIRYSLRETTRHLLKVYDATYPRVRSDWYASIIKSIKISKMLVSALGWTRYFFGDPEKNKLHLNAAVAHGPQNLSVQIINRRWLKLWRDQFYGDLRGRIRIKAQIHDSIFFQYPVSDPAVPGIVQERMREPITVTDCFGETRTMLIPPDMSAGKVRWSELK